MPLLFKGRKDITHLSETLAAPCPANGTWALMTTSTTLGSDLLPREGTVQAALLARRNILSLTFFRKHMVVIKSKPTLSQFYYRVKFSANMYHSTLGMPWNKEQVENRLSKVRNQSSSLIPDGQNVVLVVVLNVCIHVYVRVYTGI